MGKWGRSVIFPLLCLLAYVLSFFSLVFLFPWCFCFLEIPWSFEVFSAYFPGFLRVRKVREILRVLEVFLGILEKTKEKKDGVGTLLSSPSFYKHLGHAQRGVRMTLFVLLFPASG